MSHNIITECPACTTRFQVTDGQLKIANGKVRCGSCLEVFNAELYRCDDLSDPIEEISTSSAGAADPLFDQVEVPDFIPPQHKTNTIPDKRYVEEQPRDEALVEQLNQTTPLPDPAEPEIESETVSTKLYESVEEDDSFTDYDLEKPVQELFQKIETAPSPQNEKKEEADSEAFDKIISETPSLTEHPELATEALDRSDSAPTSPLEPSFSTPHIQAATENTQPKPTNLPPLESDPIEAEKQLQERSPFTAIRSEPVMLNTPTQPSSHSLAWGVLSLFALILLTAQYIWFERSTLAHQPQLGFIYNELCKRVECNLQTPYSAEQIKTQQLVVQEHPRYQGALVVSLLLQNQASFQQTYPAIRLSFSDRKGKLISQRLFQPDDYLAESKIDINSMPVNQSVQVQMDILDPGRRAVSYQAVLLPPSNRKI